MAQYLIITTVGTSIFTNFNKEVVGKAFEEHKKDYTPLNLADHESDSAQEYDEDILGEDTKGSLENIIKSKWLKGIEKKTNSTAFYLSKSADAPNPHASAEITSILKITEKLRAQDEEAKVEVQLLATDTALSVSAAKLIRKYQWPEGITVRPFDQEADYIQSLGVKPPQGSDPESFYDEGLQNLVKKLVDNQTGLIKKAKEDDYDPVINFSGGYKAIIPFLTIIAQLEGIPMYYIYEDSEYLLEMGSLPVGWDWEIVETLKPLLKPYILKQDDFQILAKALKRKQIYFSANRQKYISTGEAEHEIGKIHQNAHLAFHHLWKLKLITWNSVPESEGLISVSPLGKIMGNVNLATEKGFVMEHLLFKYFSVDEKKCELTEPYRSTQFSKDYPRHFLILDNFTSELEFASKREKGTREIGDIDLALLKPKNQTLVWAESKAYATASRYRSEIGKQKDYLFQLKARCLALHQSSSQKVELLFLVFRFVIPGITDQKGFLESAHFNEVLVHLYRLNSDPDLDQIGTFRCIGVTIPVGFKGEQLDLMDFYKGNFYRWKFEELVPAETSTP